MTAQGAKPEPRIQHQGRSVYNPAFRSNCPNRLSAWSPLSEGFTRRNTIECDRRIQEPHKHRQRGPGRDSAHQTKPTRPELVAVEGNTAPPRLFNTDFHINPSLLTKPFYLLHAWVWERNPSGLLSDWNPRVSCG